MKTLPGWGEGGAEPETSLIPSRIEIDKSSPSISFKLN
jgi:hypothetical protein